MQLTFCVNLRVATVNFHKSLKLYVIVGFLGLFINGRYHTILDAGILAQWFEMPLLLLV